MLCEFNAKPYILAHSLATVSQLIGRQVHFVDGERIQASRWKRPDTGAQNQIGKIASGDLDNEAVSDACVTPASQSGGSGTFKYLVAMRDTGNAFIQQDAILLGDRGNIGARKITGGQTNIEIVAAGSKDPACGPSQKLKLSYVLIDGEW